MAEFPWHFFLARHIPQGIIPLWEPDTWCGAIPFYARYYADTYYFPLWPFYFLSKIQDLDQTYLMTSLIPLLLHYYLAAAGMYLLIRRGMRLHVLPAFITSWVYLFSPAFAYSYVWFPIVVVQALLPWLLLLVVSMDRRVRLWKIIAAGCIIALMFFAAQPPHAGYSILLAFVLALALAARRIRCGEIREAIRAPLQLFLALILNAFLSAVYWVSIVDGAAHTKQHLSMTYESLTGVDGSIPPVYLATLLVPDLFGTLTGFGNRNWVEVVAHGVRFWEANMSGGLLLTFLALAGVFLVIKRKNQPGLRFWAILGVGIWIFSILCMLGRHTPFYYLFYKLMPVLSNFPFPIRYRMFQIIATAWLAGLGMEYLTYGDRVEKRWPRRLIWGYLLLAIIIIGIALAGPRGLTGILMGRFNLSGLENIISRGNLSWFLFNPVLYFFIAGGCIVLAWGRLRGRWRVRIVAGLVMIETALLCGTAFYFCIFRFHEPQPQQIRNFGPSVHPMIRRVLGPLTALKTDPHLRWASDQPFHDNFARLDLNGSYALMGYCMKPLEKRFKSALEAAYHRPVDWPLYWEYPRPASVSFLSNMSVGYLMESKPDNLFSGGKTVKMETNPDLYLHYNPLPLPRAFTMDRIVECSEEEAMEELVKGDLRRGVFVEDGKRLAVSGKQSLEESKQLAVSSKQSAMAGKHLPLTAHRSPLTDYSSFKRDPASINYFNELQSANRISGLDFSNPNKVKVDVDATIPAMLVLTEIWYPGWEASVDGAPVELYRVNYLQRGVWLNAGKHRIELIFRPKSWRIGMNISIISWGALILIFLVWGIRRCIRHYHPAPGYGGVST